MNSLRGEFEVTIEGKAVPCRLTMNALRLLKVDENVNLNELSKYIQEDPLTAVPTICYYAYKNAKLRSKTKSPYIDKELFISEVLDTDQLEKVSTAISEAMYDEDQAKGDAGGNVTKAKK